MIFWSCHRGDNSGHLIEVKKSPIRLTDKKLESVEISVDSLSLTRYDVFHLHTDVDPVFYGYNYMRHSIDIVDMGSKKLKGHIPLGQQGPDNILKVYGLYIINKDSIYIMDRLALKLIDANGKIKETTSLLVDRPTENLNGYFISYNEAYFEVIPQAKEFTGHFVDEGIRGEKRNMEALKKPIMATLKLGSNEPVFLPIYHSAFILENNGDFSSEITPNIFFTEDKIIYGFPVEPGIYVFDKSSGKTLNYLAKSEFCTNYALPYSKYPNYRFRNEGTWFNSVNPFPGKPFFYRTHWGNQERITDDGSPTDAYTKPGYMMLFDQDFKVIEEFKIDDRMWLEGSFSTNEGIFFWAKDIDSENKIMLWKYSFEFQ